MRSIQSWSSQATTAHTSCTVKVSSFCGRNLTSIDDRNVAADGTLNLTGLRSAVRLDSFIREVMRTKNDTLSTVRETTEDTELGGLTLPKGTRQSLVLPINIFTRADR